MSSNEEGLDLDELDVEVPTAGEAINTTTKTVPSLTINSWYLKEEERRNQIESGDEVVWREDHREALREAVQQARQRERRRILDKIKEKIDAVSDEINRLEDEEDRPKPDVAKMHHEFQRNLLEELKEEVSEK